MKPPYRRATMAELIEENAGVKMHPSMPIDEAREIADRFGVEWLDVWGAGKIMAEVYDETCEAKLIEPTFVMDHPARGLAARPRPSRRPDADRALRARRRRARARQRLLGAQRPGRSGAALPVGGEAPGRRRRGGRAGRRRLRRGARVRAAPDRRARDRHGPAGDADHRRRHDPRRDPLPDAAARGGPRRRRRRRRRSTSTSARPSRRRRAPPIQTPTRWTQAARAARARPACSPG